MELSYLKGEMLQVHLNNDEILEGKFHDYNYNKTRMTISNVVSLPNRIKLEAMCNFYEQEIRFVIRLEENLEDKLNRSLKITERECENIIITSKKYIYINKIDDSYHRAVNDLSEYSYVALSTDGASMGRKCTMPFIVLSTPNQIYIFDVQVMKQAAFFNGLKDILEGDTPKKIVHDCRKISDCLFHKHNVELNAVFDTQVGDTIVTKNKTGHVPDQIKSLQQCLNYYIGLPLNTVETKMDIVECTERPLSATIKDTLAKNIAFLHNLSTTINEQLMLPFTRGVEYYVQHLRTCDEAAAWSISTKLNELPKEFRKAIEY